MFANKWIVYNLQIIYLIPLLIVLLNPVSTICELFIYWVKNVCQTFKTSNQLFSAFNFCPLFVRCWYQNRSSFSYWVQVNGLILLPSGNCIETVVALQQRTNSEVRQNRHKSNGRVPFVFPKMTQDNASCLLITLWGHILPHLNAKEYVFLPKWTPKLPWCT